MQSRKQQKGINEDFGKLKFKIRRTWHTGEERLACLASIYAQLISETTGLGSLATTLIQKSTQLWTELFRSNFITNRINQATSLIFEKF